MREYTNGKGGKSPSKFLLSLFSGHVENSIKNHSNPQFDKCQVLDSVSYRNALN